MMELMMFNEKVTYKMLTVELFKENPLFCLIQLKKNIRLLDTTCVDDTIQKQSFIKLVETYDNGFIADTKSC